MTESQNNTPEMQSKNVASRPPNKLKGSALDRGFPTGVVLIVLAILIIILQGISAWKVMKLDNERADLEKREALFEREKKDYKHLRIELPSLRSERDELNAEIPGLKGKVSNLERRRANLLKEKAEAEAIIAKTKKAEEIHAALQASVDSFKNEIRNKTSEIQRLSGPNSQLQKRVNDFDTVVNKLDNAPKRLDEAIDQAKQKIRVSLDKVNRAAASIESDAQSLASSATSITTNLQNVSNNANSAVIKVQGAGNKLSKEAAKLSQRSNQLQAGINNLNSKIGDIATSNQRFSSLTSTISADSSKLGIATVDLKDFAKNIGNLFQTLNGDARSFNQAVNSLLQVIQGINTTSGELQVETTSLHNSADSLATSITQVKGDADRFKQRLTNRDLSQLTNVIQQNIKTISDITGKIQKDSEIISTMRSNVEDKIGNLIGEINELNNLLTVDQERLGEKLKGPSEKTIKLK